MVLRVVNGGSEDGSRSVFCGNIRRLGDAQLLVRHLRPPVKVLRETHYASLSCSSGPPGRESVSAEANEEL